MPFLVCIYGAGWLRDRYGLGDWITVVGIVLAFLLVVADIYSYGKMMLKMLDKKGGKDGSDEQNGKR